MEFAQLVQKPITYLKINKFFRLTTRRLNVKYRALIVAFLALCLGILTACSSATTATTRDDITSYDEILGTGLANTCPQLSETTRGNIPLDSSKSYRLVDLCLEPQQFFVKEESTNIRKTPEFVAGKLLTRETSTLEQISGELKINSDKSLTFIEEDGIDFQPITVQLPSGEGVPFLFTIKQLQATTAPGFETVNASVDFKGGFKVPSYRGAAFLDPKGRGVSAGYDNAVAIPSQADSGGFANLKSVEGGKGEISLQITKVDGATGEVAGVFESIQPSDTDLGADEALDVKVRGIFYGRVSEEG
jgi:photosystem II oxygen-evolving enhancer protein 1